MKILRKMIKVHKSDKIMANGKQTKYNKKAHSTGLILICFNVLATTLNITNSKTQNIPSNTQNL